MAGAFRRRRVSVGLAGTRPGAGASAADQDNAPVPVGVARVAKCESCVHDLIDLDNGL